ncbi:transcription termination factor NusA [Spiroplasma endosymbiont of Asaphidion curtum]|uniref:transcription termination factor NusA n=1 Tax=Spiroplasma endosymbiont of Asaphidion curtum TaxID=3066281 RepID=UPI00313C7468
MIDGIEILKAIDLLAEEKKIDRSLIIEAIKEGIIKAYEKYLDPQALVKVDFDEQTGQIKVYRLLTIVSKIEDEFAEILLDDIKNLEKNLKIGDIYYEPVDTDEFSRLAALQVAQILKQHLREAEKEVVYEKYISKKDDILIGTIDNIEEKYYLLKIVDRTFAILPKKNIIPTEEFYLGDKVKFYVEDVNKTKNFGQILASRTHLGFLTRLLEIEVPEIYEGIIEIKAIARIAGQRSKVAVFCNDSTIDPIGACVGNKGQRIQSIMNELNGEKIDLIKWDMETTTFIINALSPAKAISISLDEQTNEANIIVADEHYSLAIGKKGITAKLTAKLTKWKINIISFSDALNQNIAFKWNGNLSEQQMQELQNKHQFKVKKDKLLVEFKNKYWRSR